MTNLKKSQIKQIAQKCFNAGKNDLPKWQFNSSFEEYYRQAQEDYDVKEDDRLTGVFS